MQEVESRQLDRIRDAKPFVLDSETKCISAGSNLISSVRTCTPVKFVDSIIIFLRINDLRSRYFDGCTIRGGQLCRCLATFRKSWVYDLIFATIIFHAPSDFTNMLICPPQYDKVCKTENRKVNFQRLAIIEPTHSLRYPGSKSNLA